MMIIIHWSLIIIIIGKRSSGKQMKAVIFGHVCRCVRVLFITLSFTTSTTTNFHLKMMIIKKEILETRIILIQFESNPIFQSKVNQIIPYVYLFKCVVSVCVWPYDSWHLFFCFVWIFIKKIRATCISN